MASGHPESELHFGKQRDLTTITGADAEAFMSLLVARKLSSTTVHKGLQFVRAFFRVAHKRKLIAENPFAEVSAKSVISRDRQHFVSRQDNERLLSVADPTWRLIIGLIRFGGLRCPSEVLSVRWTDVDWARSRVTVPSPKTEHHEGKASREIPLFPELRPILKEAYAIRINDDFLVDGRREKAMGTSGGGIATCVLSSCELSSQPGSSRGLGSSVRCDRHEKRN